MEVGPLMNTTATLFFCICLLPLLPGCMMTHALWNQGIVDKRSGKEITISGDKVHFKAKDKIKYPFPPFSWTVKQNHDRIFTASSGTISEWFIETDPEAPRFARKGVLPTYFLPDKSILPYPAAKDMEKKYFVNSTHLKVHPDDMILFRKPFLFRGYNINGKRVISLQIPVKFHAGKLICSQPEDSGMTGGPEVNVYLQNLSRTWIFFWTPFTVICDIIFSPFYFVCKQYK